MNRYAVTYKSSDTWSACIVEAETAEEARDWFIEYREQQGRECKECEAREAVTAPKPGQTVLSVPADWSQQRTAEEIIDDIINIFDDDEELFNDCIEELDSYNGYLGDNRYYEMYMLEEFYNNCEPLELLQRVYFGYAEDDYIIDQYGEEHHQEFNPMADYFRYNGYGNLVSSNYKDYSSFLDDFAIEEIKEHRNEIYSIERNTELIALLNELEEVQR